MQERLQKVLAAAGIGSRRACEQFILDGHVRVGGLVVNELGTKVDPATDRITYNGRLIKAPTKHYYVLLNKPRGFVCSMADRHAARLVTELVDIQGSPMLRPVGRLDADTEGLLLLSDDGSFINMMTHPRYHIGKTYRALVRGRLGDDAIALLRTGVNLEDGITMPARGVHILRVIELDPDPETDLELTIFEGRNRQVRRMMKAVGTPVIRLKRTSFGPLKLSKLPIGGWRHLTQSEIEALLTLAAESETKRISTGTKEKPKQWRTEQSHLPQPKAPSSPTYSKTEPRSRRRTSSDWSNRDSTTD